jgi:uncharacterized membrane protein
VENKDKIAVDALLEDLKARWQELLNFENENSRWSTLYVTALILTISWLINNDHYGSIAELIKKRENAYFIVSLALINAIYTLAMALKGYQIQQIALYLYSEVGRNISSLIGRPFNDWERWRREEFQSRGRKRKPELVRMIYYPLIGLLPSAVSITILGLYAAYAWNDKAWYGLRNIYFYIVTALVVATGVAAIWTSGMNHRWQVVLKTGRKANAPSRHRLKSE